MSLSCILQSSGTNRRGHHTEVPVYVFTDQPTFTTSKKGYKEITCLSYKRLSQK